MFQQTEPPNIFDPQRWGLPEEAVDDIANRLRNTWSRFQECFKTKTRDPSEYAWVYLRGILTMDMERNFANIARRVIDPDDNGQNLQQFMSDSPWSGEMVFKQIQVEICQRPKLAGGVLTLDECGDEKAGNQSAGAGRQYLGRFGKVDMGQVAVGLGYYKDGVWMMVDAELYLPENWFDDAHADLRRRWHIPQSRIFATKPQLGLVLIRRAKEQGLPFEVVAADSLYGRDSHFRAELEAEQVTYVLDVPINTHVYLTKPVVEVPETPPGKVGRPFSQWQVLSDEQPVEVRSLLDQPDFTLQPVELRHTERGMLIYHCAARQVWTITDEGVVRQEWLFIWQEPDGTIHFTLSNAPLETPLPQLARWRCLRYFAERTFQDARSEAGWDELIARKYRAWMHHTALDALALWFVAEIKLDWAQLYPRDPALVHELEIAILPALSMANIRELLKAVLPLKQLSPAQARRLVIKHLVYRSRSTRSRLKAQQLCRAPT
jgi:SRSO17 transposase